MAQSRVPLVGYVRVSSVAGRRDERFQSPALQREEAFDSGFDPSGARLTGCEFVAAEMNGVYASYLCEAVLPDAQSIQFYVDGGASAGYHVAHVGLNGNPVGWEPVD